MNAVIIPTTVPNKPNNGLIVAIVPSILRFLSRLYLTSIAFSSILDSRFSLGRSLYLMQPTSKKPKDDNSEISSSCLALIRFLLKRLTIWFVSPLGDTKRFCKNQSLSTEIVIIKILQASSGHIKGPPAIIKSVIYISFKCLFCNL